LAEGARYAYGGFRAPLGPQLVSALTDPNSR